MSWGAMPRLLLSSEQLHLEDRRNRWNTKKSASHQGFTGEFVPQTLLVFGR
jgi:hypothetical protein